MGVQVQIKVSWEEVEVGNHPHAELWVRVLSTQRMKPSNVIPEGVSSQIPSEVLAGYYATSCAWFPDLREDDDETVIEWPYEQWWALPKMRTTA